MAAPSLRPTQLIYENSSPKPARDFSYPAPRVYNSSGQFYYVRYERHGLHSSKMPQTVAGASRSLAACRYTRSPVVRILDAAGFSACPCLRSHIFCQILGQIFGQVFDHMFDQVFGQVFGHVFDQVFDQVWGKVWKSKVLPLEDSNPNSRDYYLLFTI